MRTRSPRTSDLRGVRHASGGHQLAGAAWTWCGLSAIADTVLRAVRHSPAAAASPGPPPRARCPDARPCRSGRSHSMAECSLDTEARTGTVPFTPLMPPSLRSCGPPAPGTLSSRVCRARRRMGARVHGRAEAAPGQRPRPGDMARARHAGPPRRTCPPVRRTPHTDPDPIGPHAGGLQGVH